MHAQWIDKAGERRGLGADQHAAEEGSRGTTMPDTERAAAICFELSAKFADAASSGKGYERIDELNATFEMAVREVGEIVGRL
jgi:hypothetical protein